MASTSLPRMVLIWTRRKLHVSTEAKRESSTWGLLISFRYLGFVSTSLNINT